MNGLIMDFPLTLTAIMRRTEQLHGPKQIVTRLPDKSYHRYTYADMIARAKKLALALKALGIESGDRVATFSWNHYQHLEAYFGIPACGGVLHTLNLRLHPNDLTYIANHANDRVVLVDEVLWELFEKFQDEVNFEHVVVIPQTGKSLPPGTLDYEDILDAQDESKFDYPETDERQAVAMCYTSGTTGKPKGVIYTHRGMTLHTLVTCMTDTVGVCESDVILPVVPMFHANAWGLPYACAMMGAKQVFPGQHLDPPSLLESLVAERVTLTAGVPTIWLGVLQMLDQDPKAHDLSSLRGMVVGGSAAPKSLIEGFKERHGIPMIHAWGMTEMSPMGTCSKLPSRLVDAPKDEQYERLATQGPPIPFVEIRARSENGIVPWDGQSMGELEVRGPWIASAYYNPEEPSTSFTDDGWFCTGDIVVIHPDGCVHLQDRAKDVIKSGGEWISSVALENALMGHPAVAEAAVIPVNHPKWAERPLAVVVLKPGQEASAEELIDHIRNDFAKWWLPDAVEFTDEIPHTSAGKFLKTALRETYQDYYAKAAAS